jgi:predicted Zn-dependent peptidase
MMRLNSLDNGLKVASRTMPGVETVAIGLYAEAGSRHEEARVNGIAHLFEHMVFKGAGGRSARVTQYLNANGWDAVNVDGGMQHWSAQGRPLVGGVGGAEPEVI